MTAVTGPGAFSIAEGCRLTSIAHGTYFNEPKGSADYTALVGVMRAINDELEACGWRRMQVMLRGEGWLANHKKIKRPMGEHPERHPCQNPLRQRPGVRNQGRPGMGLLWSKPEPRSLGLCALGERSHRELHCARPRDELLNREIFQTLRKAQVVIASCQTLQRHSFKGYWPPAPKATFPPSWPPGYALPALQSGGETADVPTFNPNYPTGPARHLTL